MTADNDRATALVRRQRRLLMLAWTCVAVAVGGLVASTFVRSPAQQAAEAAPPSPSIVTAPVERRVLTASLVVRGTVTATAPTAVDYPGDAGERTVVTGLPLAPGDAIQPGAVVAEVSGRPVIALSGRFPAYRDLARGDTGTDVGQLQAALRDLGLRPGSSGTFDAATQRAVKALYKRVGYPAAQVSAAGAGAGDATQAELAGVGLPLSEVVFLPRLPATVGGLAASVGTVLHDERRLLTLDDATLQVTGTLPAAQAALVHPGVAATLHDDTLGATVAGHVAAVGAYRAAGAVAAGAAEAGEGEGAVAAGHPVTFTTDEPLDPSWSGASVRIEIATSSTDGPVLAVPVSAVLSDESGAPYVDAVRDGARHRVDVTAGTVADGMVEVTPTSGDTLTESDVVATIQ